MPDEPERITKPAKPKPLPAAPVYDETPAVRLEYPRLVKRPRVALPSKAVTVSISPEAKAAKGGLISKTKPPAKPSAKPKATTKAIKPR